MRGIQNETISSWRSCLEALVIILSLLMNENARWMNRRVLDLEFSDETGLLILVKRWIVWVTCRQKRLTRKTIVRAQFGHVWLSCERSCMKIRRRVYKKKNLKEWIQMSQSAEVDCSWVLNPPAYR